MTIRTLTQAGPWTWPAARNAAPLLLTYKHSPVCGASSAARAEVTAFQTALPEIPVYLVDVLQRRPLSRMMADALSIEHESPLAILLAGGVPVWHTSHFRIPASALAEQVRRQPAGRGGADVPGLS